MHGDGFTDVVHCENVDAYGVDPFGGPMFCSPEPEAPPELLWLQWHGDGEPGDGPVSEGDVT